MTQDWRAAKAALDPNPFCESLPYQLQYYDNTAWQTAQHCWRHHWYQTIRGLRPRPSLDGLGSVHLTFGDLVHQAADVFTKARAIGAPDADALDFALDHVLKISWPEGQERDVFGGFYAPVFQCTDRTKTNSKKGIHRCAWSKTEHLVTPEHVENGSAIWICKHCLQPVDHRIAYICPEKVKNRRTLVRSVIALCDALARSNIRAKVLPDGRIGSELRWFKELHLVSPDGKPYTMTGSFDGAATSGTTHSVIPEYKTTQREPNEKYWSGLEMSPQVHTYSWAGVGEFGQGTRVVIFGIHIGVGFTEVYQKAVYFSPERLAEWEEDLAGVIQEAEIRAQLAVQLEAQSQDPSTAFPRRLSACSSLPGAPTTPCPFRDYCSISPVDREGFLEANFVVEHWNPIAAKGATMPVEEVEE